MFLQGAVWQWFHLRIARALFTMYNAAIKTREDIGLRKSLDGVKILEFTRLLPGPFGTQILGDLGADVLKIEDTKGGDYTRYIPPMFGDMSAFFCALNRNKRSLRLDLKKPTALSIVHRLVKQANYDVVIEGFRPGIAERLGIDYESLNKLCPGLIYASLPGYGQGSPSQNKAAHDMNLLALSGILSVSGSKEHGPTIPGIQMDDMATGMYMAIGVLAALHHRQTTGEGQRVEASMADTAMALNAINVCNAFAAGKPQGFKEHPLTGAYISYNLYKTKDGRYLSVGAVEPKFWINVCNAIGLPELIDEQFADAKEGDVHFEKFRSRIEEKTQAEWITIFENVDGCVEPVLDSAEAARHPHYVSSKMVRPLTHPEVGDVTYVSLPVRLSRTPFDVFRHAPVPGNDTVDALTEAGFNENEIEKWKEEGIIS